MKLIRRISRFLGRVIGSAVRALYTATKELVVNIDSTAMLVLASIGAARVLYELPFRYSVPAWIGLEIPMVVPVLSVLAVYLLATLIVWRSA